MKISDTEFATYKSIRPFHPLVGIVSLNQTGTRRCPNIKDLTGSLNLLLMFDLLNLWSFGERSEGKSDRADTHVRLFGFTRNAVLKGLGHFRVFLNCQLCKMISPVVETDATVCKSRAAHPGSGCPPRWKW